MSYGDGFFDVPAGYSDADLETSELEDLGRRAAMRYRGFTSDQIGALRVAGSCETVTVTRYYGPADDRRSYSVQVRSVDADEVGPILSYSVHGAEWHPTAREAREHWQATFASSRVD